MTTSKESSFFYESGFEFFRILINSILYLTSSGADIVERKKIKSGKKRAEAKRNEMKIRVIIQKVLIIMKLVTLLVQYLLIIMNLI